MLNANYTYSHTISNAENEFNTSGLNPRRAQDTNQIGQDRSNSDLDVNHKFALSLTYDVPSAGFGNRFAKALFGGFGLGTSVLAQSGQPVTIRSGIDSNGNVDTAGDRAFLNLAGSGNVPGEAGQGDVFPVCEGAGGTTYIGSTSFLAAPLNGCNQNNSAPFLFDPAIGYTPVNSNDKYVIAGAGVVSNLGRNSFRSPGFWTWNLSAHKNIYFTEAKYLQLRHCFEELGCRRVELKTDRRNEKSRNAMLRIGAQFEGIARKQMVTFDGTNRDNAWFAIIDDDWPSVKARLEAMLGTTAPER